MATAYMWMNLEAVSKSKPKQFRDDMEQEMTKEQIAEGQKLSREWLERKAKEKGE